MENIRTAPKKVSWRDSIPCERHHQCLGHASRDTLRLLVGTAISLLVAFSNGLPSVVPQPEMLLPQSSKSQVSVPLGTPYAESQKRASGATAAQDESNTLISTSFQEARKVSLTSLTNPRSSELVVSPGTLRLSTTILAIYKLSSHTHNSFWRPSSNPIHFDIFLWFWVQNQVPQMLCK